MHPNEYQHLANRTRGKFTEPNDQIRFAALEMASETGEVCNVVYKTIYQGHPPSPEKLCEELGDVLWGIAVMCDALGVPLEVVMEENIEKLRKRYPTGFTTADSIARRDHSPSTDRLTGWAPGYAYHKSGPGVHEATIHATLDAAFEAAYTDLVNGENISVTIMSTTDPHSQQWTANDVIEWGRAREDGHVRSRGV